MFDKLEDILFRFDEIMNQLSEPDVANDTNRFRKLMKEQSDLSPIVEAYKEYKQEKQNIEDSLASCLPGHAQSLNKDIRWISKIFSLFG